MTIRRTKAIAAVTAAAIALTSAGSAFAGTKAGSQNSAIEFSSGNRYPNYGYAPRYRNNDAAAAAVVGSIIAGVAAYAAAREYRKARERERANYGYGSYAPQPYGYDDY